nr:RagB/SusD family nutrient uptake outer membrane protein [Paramuribaculum sp.]
HQQIPFESWCVAAPTQNMVDAYLVIDEQDGLAKPWNETSQFINNTVEITEDEALPLYSYMGVNDAGEPAAIANYTYASSTEKYLKGYKVTTEGANISELMYNNRDARFYGSIIYDGCRFYDEDITCYYHGNFGRYGRDTYNGYVPITNYAGLKGVYNVSPRYINTSFTDYHEVVSRYGRAILNKAEALLRLNKVAEAVDVFNQTRTIHGQLPPSTASTLAEAWTDYKRERRVELYFESDWYWSLLRWGCYGGEANYGKPSKGEIPELTEPANFIEINQQREVAFVAELGNMNNMRLFPVPTYYLFPVPQSLINANPAVTDADQNPGY